MPAPCCIPIDKKLPIETAALIGLCGGDRVGATICTAPVKPGVSVVVLGAGGVGLSIVQGAKLCGATDIIVVDRFQSRLDYAKTFGATATVLADTDCRVPSRNKPADAEQAFVTKQLVHLVCRNKVLR